MKTIFTKYLLSFLALTTVLAIGCLDPIELDIPKGSDDAIVINAKLVLGEQATFTLELTRLFSFTVESRARIIAREVKVFDEQGNEMIIKPFADGFYNYPFKETDPIKIELGNKYKMSLELFDGRIFESSFEPLLDVPKIKKIYFDTLEKSFILPDQTTRTGRFISYSVDTELSLPGEEEKSAIRWELRKTYKVTDTPISSKIMQKTCYVDEKAGVFDILIINGKGQTRTSLDNYYLYDENITSAYGEGLYFTIIQESLSPSAYEYWEKVKNISERKDNIYSDPPGKVSSNYININGDDEAYGFFYVTKQDTARVYIDPEFVKPPSTRCPSPNLFCMDGGCCDLLCCDCIAVDNSDTTKPNFWIH